MAVHKHMILRTIEANPASPNIEITIDALIDLGAEELINETVRANHTYGTRPRHGKVATTFVDVAKLKPFLVDTPAPKKTKAKE